MAICSCRIYATRKKGLPFAIPFRSKSGRSYKAKVALQCRQQPETFKVQAETIGAGSRRICPIIPNNEIEYFSEVRSAIIPYGLLIRVFQ
ncbi:unnamed protein product [Rotaria magnacalcarata]|uniref:Uncharacterized protein n=1 Tax=Rotaria magnacalcarata TaxID=392030 RepID=A0A814G9F9_9BILA|nr:unnamed protein product [Rotaria magnacalcarata]CAF4406482.1 unnamed protein product [Rotaria magnacalcarata]